MPMQIIECEQGSMEWFQARRGIPSASNFHRIMTAKTMKLSAQADDYIYELIGEQLSSMLPENAESFTSRAMRWGKETEAEARSQYEVWTNTTVEKSPKIGFCISEDGKIGGSPDGIVKGMKRGLELKCVLPKTQARYLLEDVLPDDHRGQVHGSLVYSNYDEWDFYSYCPGMAPFHKRVEPDAYTLQLSKIIYEEFLPRYELLFAKIKGVA